MKKQRSSKQHKLKIKQNKQSRITPNNRKIENNNNNNNYYYYYYYYHHHLVIIIIVPMSCLCVI